MKKRYIFLTMVFVLAGLLINLGSSAELYANTREGESQILSLIEEGAIDYESQRFVLALRKYKEATSLLYNIITKEPDNKRILLLKELVDKKIAECRLEIEKIEVEIDPDFLNDKKLSKVYDLIEEANIDRDEQRYYIALKKYSKAERYIQSILEEDPEQEEARLLFGLIANKKASVRREIETVDGPGAEERQFVNSIKEITGIIKEASKDERSGRYLIARRKYRRAISLLEDLEKDFPNKRTRISITKEMAQIRLGECNATIESLGGPLEARVTRKPIEPAKEPIKEPARKLAREPIIEPAREVEVLRVVKKPAEKQVVEKERIEKEERVEYVEKRPHVEYHVTEEPKVEERLPVKIERKRFAFPKITLPSIPFGKITSYFRPRYATRGLKPTLGRIDRTKESLVRYAETSRETTKNGLSKLKEILSPNSIKGFIAKSRENAREEASKAYSINSTRQSNIINGLKNLMGLIKRKISQAKETIKGPEEEIIEAVGKVEVAEITKPEVKEVPVALGEIKEVPVALEREAEIIEEVHAPKEIQVKKLEETGRQWIDARKRKPSGYNFSSYREDPDIKFVSNEREFKFASPVLRKGNDIWVPLEEFAKEFNLTYLRPGKTSVIVISQEGMPLEMNIGEKDVLINKQLFMKMSKPLAAYGDKIMLSLDSIKEVFEIAYEYSPDTNTVKIISGRKAKFTTFSMVKPPEVIEEEKRLHEAEGLIKPPSLPRGIRKELLPIEYYPDVDLRLNTSFRYFHDMLANRRTRYNEYYMDGTLYGVKAYGHLSLRDYQTDEKAVIQEDAQHLSFFKDGSGIKLLDNYMRLPGVKSQSHSYWGIEVDNQNKDELIKNYLWAGEMDPISVSKVDGSGSVKYFGNLYSGKQDIIDTDNLKLSAVELFTHSESENFDDTGLTTHPRNNFVYLLDTMWKPRSELTWYNTFAQSTYMPDNERDIVIPDYDFKTRMKYKEDRFSATTSFEFVGDRYASLGIPSAYQDFIGSNIYSNYKITEDLNLNISGDLSRDNVAFNDDRAHTDNAGISTGLNWALPWKQNLSFGWSYDRYQTSGGDGDSSGSEYKTYRLDYYKNLGTASLQLAWQYYRMDPLASNTGSLFYHTYSASLYKSFPELHGSFVRLYQDMTKTKELSMAGLPAKITYNTDLSGKLYVLPYLSFSGGARLRSAYQEQVENTSIFSLSAGVDYKPGPDTDLGLTYEVGNMDLYDNYRRTDDWSILFYARHIFGFRSAEKWGNVKVYVFEDLNGNDIKDAEEIGLGDILAYVIKGRGAQTNADGIALIRKVVPGAREVMLDLRDLPVDMVIKGDSTKGVAVNPLKTSEITFIIVTTGEIRGRVYVDKDGNGKFDKDIDLPLPNIRLFLTPDFMDTLSFSDGSYMFEYVYPGIHQVNMDTKNVPLEYKLISPESINIEVESKKTKEDVDFTFEGRQIKVKYF